jgi:DNA-binding beta-propeller fold protein YncE
VPLAGRQEISDNKQEAVPCEQPPAIQKGSAMTFKFHNSIDLPEHLAPGGFDHAAYHAAKGWLYVAHTINNALDVIDCKTDRHLHSIPNLTGVAGALVSQERNLVFTSNRGENTIGIFRADAESELVKVSVGIRPNGLAFDPSRGHLLAANVGDPAIPGSFTLSLVDVAAGKMVASILVPGRTRWALYDFQADAFYVNISDPAQIVVLDGKHADRIARVMDIPAVGPHGLDLDTQTGRLFCACDEKKLVTLDAKSGQIQSELPLSGSPDVIFFNPALHHLYVASGDPGLIDVFDTDRMRLLESVQTEKGAHTIGYDSDRNKVYAFLPLTHRASVYQDS